MDSEFLFFLAIFSGVMGLVFFGIAIAYRCPACGSLTHGFKSDKVGDLDRGQAVGAEGEVAGDLLDAVEP